MQKLTLKLDQDALCSVSWRPHLVALSRFWRCLFLFALASLDVEEIQSHSSILDTGVLNTTQHHNSWWAPANSVYNKVL